MKYEYKREEQIPLDSKYLLTHTLPKCQYPKNINGYLVPCGHCDICIDNYRKEWTTRNKIEFNKHKISSLITLTFDDEHLQDTSFNQIKHFIKRLKKYIKEKEQRDIKIKYFGAYENGENSTLRPHYHIMLYGWYPKAIRNSKGIITQTAYEIINNIWQKGITNIKIADGNAPRYITSYITKQLIPPNYKNQFKTINEWKKYNKYSTEIIRRQPFIFMSNGIGFQSKEKNKKLTDKNYIAMNGYKLKLPKGIREKSKREQNEIINFKLLIENSEIINKEFEEYIKRNPTNDINDIDYLKDYVQTHFTSMDCKKKILDTKKELFKK